MTLMSRLGVVRGNSKWRCSLDHDMTFYWSAIVSKCSLLVSVDIDCFIDCLLLFNCAYFARFL